MNFSQWGGKLMPNLKGLDELAQEDDYVNSDGLNVKRYDSDDDEHETTSLVHAEASSSMHSPLHHQYQQDASRIIEQEHQDTEIGQASVLRGRNEPVRKPQGVLEIEMSESSDHEDPYSSHAPSNHHSKIIGSINGSKKHRFMQDLDDRLAKEEPPELPSAIPLRNVRVSLSSSSTSTLANNNPVRKLASLFGLQKQTNTTDTSEQESTNNPNNDEKNNGTLPPLSKERMRPKRSSSSYPSQHIDKVSSNNMLDADDLLALEQMKQLTDAQNEFDIRQFLQSHSRESFIGLTLLLSVAVYFFGRRFSVEDDIH